MRRISKNEVETAQRSGKKVSVKSTVEPKPKKNQGDLLLESIERLVNELGQTTQITLKVLQTVGDKKQLDVKIIDMPEIPKKTIKVENINLDRFGTIQDLELTEL